MASLLDRMEVDPVSGPIRNRGGRAGSVPYSRPNRLGHSKADADATWKHDLYNGPKSLSDRLSNSANASTTGGSARKVDLSGVEQALRAAGVSGGEISIKGASRSANVVEVAGLVNGTTAADVEAIFKRCGPILSSQIHGPKSGDSVVVRLTFKEAKDAKAAVQKYNGQSADGRTLRVSIVGSANATLGGRLGVGLNSGTVDGLIDGDEAGGSKMRSDSLISDPRAQVLVSPPGVDSPQFHSGNSRGRGGRRGGRGGRRGRGRGGNLQMEID